MPKFKIGDKVVLKKGAAEMIYGGKGDNKSSFTQREIWMKEIKKHEDKTAIVIMIETIPLYDNNIRTPLFYAIDTLGDGFGINEECLDYCQREQMLELENEL